MHGRSYGNVRELIVSGDKEAVKGQTGYKSSRLFPWFRGGQRPPGREATRNKEQPSSTAEAKENEAKREGQ